MILDMVGGDYIARNLEAIAVRRPHRADRLPDGATRREVDFRLLRAEARDADGFVTAFAAPGDEGEARRSRCGKCSAAAEPGAEPGR